MSAVAWIGKLLLIVVAYLILYFTFGYFIAWKNPAVRAYYGGSNEMSEAAAEGTDHVDMTIDRVEVHIADPNVQDDVGAEWLVLSEDEQVIPLVEAKPQSHQIATGDAPVGSYDQVKLHITSAEYQTTDGDLYDLSPGDFLNGNLIVVTDFCVNEGAETVLDSQYHTTLTGDGGVSTGFDLDVAVDDGGSCSL